MVTEAMKLKDTSSPWKKSYDQPRQHIKKHRYYFANKGPSSQFSSVQSVQSLSCVQLFVTPGTAARQASLSITNSRNSPKPMSIESLVDGCYPTISSSVFLFSSCLQSFPASESFPMSPLFTSGGQSIGVSSSASILPMNTQD